MDFAREKEMRMRKRLRRQKLEKVRKEDKREKVISRLLTAGSDLRC